MKIVFATNNKNKILEVQQLLPPTIEIVSLESIGCFEEIPETADTIEENAIMKANYADPKIRLRLFCRRHWTGSRSVKRGSRCLLGTIRRRTTQRRRQHEQTIGFLVE